MVQHRAEGFNAVRRSEEHFAFLHTRFQTICSDLKTVGLQWIAKDDATQIKTKSVQISSRTHECMFAHSSPVA